MDTIFNSLSQVSVLEWSANILTAICIILAGRNNVHTWWTGIVACILFGALFFEFKLYADAQLQLFFIATSIVGWYGWVTKKENALAAAKIKFGPGVNWITATGIIAGTVYAGYSHALMYYTDAAAPMLDSAILILSMVAQIFMMRRYVLSWPLWVAVNTIAVPLFFSRELYLTSIMYTFYWFHAFYGWYNWHKLSKE